MNSKEFEEELKKISIILTNEQQEKLEKFYNLLVEWNQKINLTRIIDKEDVYLKHFYDSLTLIKIIDLNKAESLCDVGSGAGFPGVVLKIVFPHLKVILIDSLLKRVNYLNAIIKELNLQDIEAIHVRAEDYINEAENKFDIVTARAVANLNTLASYCLPLVKINGNFVAMKGHVQEELAEFRQNLDYYKSKIDDIKEFKLPYEESDRTLILIKKLEKTPNLKKKIVGKKK